MKQSLLFFGIVGAMFASCSSDEPMPMMNDAIDNAAVAVSENRTIRSVDEAINIVAEQYGNIIGERTSRAGLNIDRSNVIALGSKRASRSGAADTALYVINFGDNSGFAVVTANRGLAPILAMTDNGEINDIDDIEVPAVKEFMNASIRYASTNGGNLTLNPIDSLRETPQYWYEVRDTTIITEQAPVVKVAWGEKWPLGYFCPNKLAGCTVTAAAQALSYFEYPKSITLTYPEKDRNTQSLNWTSFRNNIVSSNDYPSDVSGISLLDDRFALARFCREMGYKIGADYFNKNAIYLGSPAVTLASMENLNDYLKGLSMPVTISSVAYGAPNVTGLSNWDVILMEGKETESSEISHVWIIDGYKTIKQHVKVYILKAYDWVIIGPDGKPILPKDAKLDYEYDVPQSSLSHINWGWNGSFNGYYNVGVYNTDRCVTPDPSSAGLDSYKYDYIVGYFTMRKR